VLNQLARITGLVQQRGACATITSLRACREVATQQRGALILELLHRRARWSDRPSIWPPAIAGIASTWPTLGRW